MNQKKYACSCCAGWGWVDDPPEAQIINYVDAELAYRMGQMKAVWDFLSPNSSNDMDWADEIIIAIEHYAQVGQSDDPALDAKDAERYRLLRSMAHKKTAYDRFGDGAYWNIGIHSDDSGQSFDEVVDAAIAAEDSK